MMKQEVDRDADVIVIGSGFGGSAAALRFSEAGQKVIVLERGRWITRASFEADPDALWNPHRQRFGMNELRPRGRHIIPWLGAGVGGGSHVYAATLKRRVHFDDFPRAIAEEDMDRYYRRAETMMGATRYPEHAPYGNVRATQLLYQAGKALAKSHPELVEDWGAINLGISFTPPPSVAGGNGSAVGDDGPVPGARFINQHGCEQRYSDPADQSLLGGDIGAKNSLDRNYLFLAQEHGAEIRALHQADKIEPLAGGGYRVHFIRYVEEKNGWRRFLRNWLPSRRPSQDTAGSLTCRRLVVAAGAIGSTELLMRNRDVHRTLPDLSPCLGTRYASNGDYVSLMLPFRGFFVGWLGFILALTAIFARSVWLGGIGALLYFGALLFSRAPFDPDIGVTNSDYIRFRHRDGSSQGAYIEGGRYPTPIRLGLAVVMSGLGLYKPRRYRLIVHVTRFLRRFVPPFALIARSWPIPLLEMGRDDAVGTFKLDAAGQAEIDYPFEANNDFYDYLDRIGKLTSKAVSSWWFPNLPARMLQRIEIPHNLGGVPMGESPADGVVDHAGRVFGRDDLMVLDGSIVPVTLGPNPALTILALAERAMEVVCADTNSALDPGSV